MSEICMMSLTRDEVAERKDYDAIKASFDDLWSSINSNENANVSICTSEGTCLFVEREQQLYNVKLGVDQKEGYVSCRVNQVEIEEVERFLKTYPNHPRTDYAYYLLAILYYDQIVDETKDLNSLLK